MLTRCLKLHCNLFRQDQAGGDEEKPKESDDDGGGGGAGCGDAGAA